MKKINQVMEQLQKGASEEQLLKSKLAKTYIKHYNFFNREKREHGPAVAATFDLPSNKEQIYINHHSDARNAFKINANAPDYSNYNGEENLLIEYSTNYNPVICRSLFSDNRWRKIYVFNNFPQQLGAVSIKNTNYTGTLNFSELLEY